MNKSRIDKIAGQVFSRRMKADSSRDLANSILGWGIITKKDFRALDTEVTIATRMMDLDVKQAQYELGRLEGILGNFIDDLKGMLVVVRSSSNQLPRIAAKPTKDFENKVEDASRIPKRFGCK